MEKQQYLSIRNNSQADTMPVYYLYYTQHKKKDKASLSFEQFRHCFSYFILSLFGNGFTKIQYKVFKELDQYFKIN